MTASLHWKNRWTNSISKLTWKSGRSVQSISIFCFEASKTFVSYLVLCRLDYCNAVLVLCRLDYCNAVLWWLSSGSPGQNSKSDDLHSSANFLNFSTLLLYPSVSTGYQWAVRFNTKQLSPASIQLLHTSLSCFISTLLLTLFTQPQIFGSCVLQEWAGGPWGRDPFSTLDLPVWNSLLLSVRASLFTLLLLVKTESKTNKKPPFLFCIMTYRLYEMSFQSPHFYQPITSNAYMYV